MITEEILDLLRIKVKSYVNERTYSHILGVEREAASLADIYLPEGERNKARAAALLHDITKNETVEKQLQYCREFGIILGVDPLSPKLYHSKTAAVLIERDFPEFADPEIVSAVRWHTTGRDNMTVFEAIIYLADYIEDTRTYDDCIKLRRYFYDGISHLSSAEDKIFHLYKTMVKSFNYTMTVLMEENALIDEDTLRCRNYSLRKIKDN